jgi:hypothetical protein
MGYDSRVTGELELDPPVPYKIFKNSPFYDLSPAYDKGDAPAVVFEVSSFEQDTDQGTLTIRQAIAIVPGEEGWGKLYKIMEEVQAALDILPAATKVTGYLQGRGEGTHDVWRIYVGEGLRAVKVVGRTVYPLSQHGLAAEDAVVHGR